MLDPASQQRIVAGILEYRRARSVLWVLSRVEYAEHFDRVLVLERGRLVERGAFAELKAGGGALQRLLKTG